MDRLRSNSVKQGVVVLVALLGLLLQGHGSGGREQSGDGQGGRSRGVVVEEVGDGSALAKAGIRVGDVLLSWTSASSETGEIFSPFEWEWLTLEQAPRGTVRLTGRRGGEVKVFEVTPGLWDAEVRPVMRSSLLEIFLQGSQAEDLEAATALWEKLAGSVEPGTDWRLRCWILVRTGELWSKAREWEKAHAAYRSALAVAQDPLSQGAVRQAIGDASMKQSEFESARKVYAELREIRENTWGESLVLAKGLIDLGEVAWYQGKLTSAQDYFKQAQKIQQWLAPDSLVVAHSMNNLGAVAQNRGDLERAVKYYQRALEIRRRLAPDSLVVAIGLNNLGVAARNRGDLERAAESCRRALEIQQRLAPDSLDVAFSMNELGVVTRSRGDLEGAAEYYRRALEIRRQLAPDSLDMASSLNQLGTVARDRGDPEQATEYFQRALEIQQKLAPDSLDMAGILNNLGVVTLDRGDLERATEYHQRALEIWQQLAPNSLVVARGLNNLAAVARGRSDLKRAAENYQRALEIYQQLAPDSSAEAATLHALGTLSRMQNHPQLALDFFEQALNALENQVGRLGGSHDVRAGFRNQYRTYYRDAIEVFLELDQPAEAFATLERSRAQSFLAQLAERDTVFSIDVPAELDQARRRLAVRSDRLHQQLLKLNPKEEPDRLRALSEERRQIREERDDVVEQIRRASPKLAALHYPEPLNLRAAQQALDPGTVMLSYSVGEESSHVFVVPHTGEPRVEPLHLGDKELRKKVEDFLWLVRKQRRGSSHMPNLVRYGKELYEILIRPVEESVAAGERVVIVPDGPLHLLPFAALIRPGEDRARLQRPWQYLVEWKPLHSVLSATIYAELRKTRPETSAGRPVELVAFGDPFYPESLHGYSDGEEAIHGDAGRNLDVYVRAATERGYRFPPLPHSRREVDGIAGLFPASRVHTYLGREATEERAKALGKNVTVLHFATHGKVDDSFPLSSFLALTLYEESEEGRDNGLLQAWEIFERVRLDADLVVLSACETALGKDLGGEGLVGLTRAFQYAGARTVAATLWKVDDEATAELMVRFYGHLRDGKSKDEALRAAQIERIRDSKADPAPYFWATFQLYGDWR